jgi:hypothetical protein
MNYYKLRINEENKIWRKHIIYNEVFVLGDSEIKFAEAYSTHTITGLKIQALYNGDVIKEESFFEKRKMSEFCVIQRMMLIKEDVIEGVDFSDLQGVSFIDVLVDGTFSKKYKLLNFSEAVNCVDEVNSVRAEFDFFNTLILDSTKIPQNIDGFFLKGWNEYGKFVCVVGDKLKDRLSTLRRAKDFLIFDKIQVSQV